MCSHAVVHQLNDALQLENNVEFHEFLEVHKSKTNKSAWGNDIVLPVSEKRSHKKDRSSRESHNCDAEEREATHKAGAGKVELKKKLSDLEVIMFWHVHCTRSTLCLHNTCCCRCVSMSVRHKSVFY